MAAKREVRDGKDSIQRITARLRADKVKRALGERGTVWWTDGAPDYHRCLAVNTPYASWFAADD
jgi:CO/xanthine dehydrogenase Mo-binding subunit